MVQFSHNKSQAINSQPRICAIYQIIIFCQRCLFNLQNICMGVTRFAPGSHLLLFIFRDITHSQIQYPKKCIICLKYSLRFCYLAQLEVEILNRICIVYNILISCGYMKQVDNFGQLFLQDAIQGEYFFPHLSSN